MNQGWSGVLGNAQEQTGTDLLPSALSRPLLWLSRHTFLCCEMCLPFVNFEQAFNGLGILPLWKNDIFSSDQTILAVRVCFQCQPGSLPP